MTSLSQMLHVVEMDPGHWLNIFERKGKLVVIRRNQKFMRRARRGYVAPAVPIEMVAAKGNRAWARLERWRCQKRGSA